MSFQNGVTKTPDLSPKSIELKPPSARGQIAASDNTVRRSAATATGGEAAQAGGEVSPVVWDVLTTETINILVPENATSVDIERVKTIRKTDADGTIVDVSQINYPV